MKNTNERMDSIFKKADAYKKKRAKTRKLIFSGGTVAVCAAIVLSITLTPQLFNPDNAVPGSTASGVTIPAVKLPESDSGVSLSMIGLVVYDGRIYTQAQSLKLDDAGVAGWLGEKLGTATGNLNEWSTQSDYATEFASTIMGDVYAVKGFDTTFRLCIPMPDYDGGTYLSFFENLNGLTVYTGADLYEKLQLKENFTGVTYQLHEDWDYGKNHYQTFTDISDGQLNSFLDALYASPFEDLTNAEDPYSSGLKQTHLYFAMADGTTVGLRLFEGGYVAYEYMYDRVFVHMTDDIFNVIFNASTT